MAFPGTITVKPETLRSLIRDYCVSLAKHGFKNVVIIPSHGGDFDPVREVADELNQSFEGTKIVSYTDLQALFKMLAEFSSKYGISAAESGGHAGESETSMVLALRKDLVNMDRAEEGFVGNYEEKVPLIWREGIKIIAENGVVGDPRQAEAGKGEEYLDLWADKMVDFVRKQAKI
jgi:creatinine amidohydrolase